MAATWWPTVLGLMCSVAAISAVNFSLAAGWPRPNDKRPPASRHDAPLVATPQRLHTAGQRQLRRGDHLGQLA